MTELPSLAEEHLNKHFDEDFQMIEHEIGSDSFKIDFAWEKEGTEKRIRIKKEKEKLPVVFLCSDYKDERSSFGIRVLNSRVEAETLEEHLRKALDKILKHTE